MRLRYASFSQKNGRARRQTRRGGASGGRDGPVGAAGLFWLWERLSWKRAFAAGWFAGFVFFSISFSWITHALGADLGLIAPFIVVIVAAILALYVGAAGAFAHLAYVRAHPAVAGGA